MSTNAFFNSSVSSNKVDEVELNLSSIDAMAVSAF